MNRWRCKVCETLNELNTTVCIVCDFDQKVGERAEAPKKITYCGFPGCKSIAAGERYCEYHTYAVCPICTRKLKATGLDYCVDCGMEVVERSTSGLRKANKIMQIVDISMLIVFLLLIVSDFLL